MRGVVLLTLVINRLCHHVSTHTEVQPLQDRLQLHVHTLENPVIGCQRGQEHCQHWTTEEMKTYIEGDSCVELFSTCDRTNYLRYSPTCVSFSKKIK